jgi:hypothetical protein
MTRNHLAMNSGTSELARINDQHAELGATKLKAVVDGRGTWRVQTWKIESDMS